MAPPGIISSFLQTQELHTERTGKQMTMCFAETILPSVVDILKGVQYRWWRYE